MEYIKNTVKGINIAYIGGGSRGWAWSLMSDLAVEDQISGTVKLYDVDYEAAKGNEIIGNRLKERDDTKGKWDYIAVNTLEEALMDADFVVLSILPGTFKEMHSDVHTPEKYGIYQSVGDSVGPGGLVRALRTIPMYVEIAKAIKKYSPDAWVINFTNPMTLCTRVLYEVFPKVKAFGNCHEVFGTQKLLADALEDMEGIKEVNREEIKVDVLGINHFTWINKATYKGMDLFPIYNKFVQKYYISGYEKNKTGHWMNDFFSSANRVKFDLFNRYGIIAAAGDRHLAEFCTNLWYLKDEETVNSWKFGLTPVSWRINEQKERFNKANKLISGDELFKVKKSDEEGVRQIKALLGLEDLVTNVNLPNTGQIKNLPLGAVVETNALFQKDKVLPIISGELPLPVHNLVIRHINNQELILKAGLQKNKELAFRAFINDPLVNMTIEDARECFEEMLKNTSDYLEL